MSTTHETIIAALGALSAIADTIEASGNKASDSAVVPAELRKSKAQWYAAVYMVVSKGPREIAYLRRALTEWAACRAAARLRWILSAGAAPPVAKSNEHHSSVPDALANGSDGGVQIPRYLTNGVLARLITAADQYRLTSGAARALLQSLDTTLVVASAPGAGGDDAPISSVDAIMTAAFRRYVLDPLRLPLLRTLELYLTRRRYRAAAAVLGPSVVRRIFGAAGGATCGCGGAAASKDSRPVAWLWRDSPSLDAAHVGGSSAKATKSAALAKSAKKFAFLLGAAQPASRAPNTSAAGGQATAVFNLTDSTNGDGLDEPADLVALIIDETSVEQTFEAAVADGTGLGTSAQLLGRAVDVVRRCCLQPGGRVDDVRREQRARWVGDALAKVVADVAPAAQDALGSAVTLHLMRGPDDGALEGLLRLQAATDGTQTTVNDKTNVASMKIAPTIGSRWKLAFSAIVAAQTDAYSDLAQTACESTPMTKVAAPPTTTGAEELYELFDVAGVNGKAKKRPGGAFTLAAPTFDAYLLQPLIQVTARFYSRLTALMVVAGGGCSRTDVDDPQSFSVTVSVPASDAAGANASNGTLYGNRVAAALRDKALSELVRTVDVARFLQGARALYASEVDLISGLFPGPAMTMDASGVLAVNGAALIRPQQQRHHSGDACPLAADAATNAVRDLFADEGTWQFAAMLQGAPRAASASTAAVSIVSPHTAWAAFSAAAISSRLLDTSLLQQLLVGSMSPELTPSPSCAGPTGRTPSASTTHGIMAAYLTHVLDVFVDGAATFGRESASAAPVGRPSDDGGDSTQWHRVFGRIGVMTRATCGGLSIEDVTSWMHTLIALARRRAVAVAALPEAERVHFVDNDNSWVPTQLQDNAAVGAPSTSSHQPQVDAHATQLRALLRAAVCSGVAPVVSDWLQRICQQYQTQLRRAPAAAGGDCDGGGSGSVGDLLCRVGALCWFLRLLSDTWIRDASAWAALSNALGDAMAKHVAVAAPTPVGRPAAAAPSATTAAPHVIKLPEALSHFTDILLRDDSPTGGCRAGDRNDESALGIMLSSWVQPQRPTAALTNASNVPSALPPSPAPPSVSFVVTDASLPLLQRFAAATGAGTPGGVFLTLWDSIFGSARDRDIFAAYYRTRMARRLLSQAAAGGGSSNDGGVGSGATNFESERRVLQHMQRSCDRAFTRHFEVMLNDMESCAGFNQRLLVALERYLPASRSGTVTPAGAGGPVAWFKRGVARSCGTNRLSTDNGADAEASNPFVMGTQRLPDAVGFSACVLTSANWPEAFLTHRVGTPLPRLPLGMQLWVDFLSSHYAHNYHTRKLSWQWDRCGCVLVATFPKGTKELGTSLWQALIMLAIDASAAAPSMSNAGAGEAPTFAASHLLPPFVDGAQNDPLTVAGIARAVGLPDTATVRPHLASLFQQKGLQLLRRRGEAQRRDGPAAAAPPSTRIEDSDAFELNPDFVAKVRRLRLPQPAVARVGGGPDVQQSQVEAMRAQILDAAIVRAMKARRELTYAALLTLVAAQLSRVFVPQPRQFKTRVEHLITLEYLRRDDSDTDLVHYCA